MHVVFTLTDLVFSEGRRWLHVQCYTKFPTLRNSCVCAPPPGLEHKPAVAGRQAGYKNRQQSITWHRAAAMATSYLKVQSACSWDILLSTGHLPCMHNCGEFCVSPVTSVMIVSSSFLPSVGTALLMQSHSVLTSSGWVMDEFKPFIETIQGSTWFHNSALTIHSQIKHRCGVELHFAKQIAQTTHKLLFICSICEPACLFLIWKADVSLSHWLLSVISAYCVYCVMVLNHCAFITSRCYYCVNELK